MKSITDIALDQKSHTLTLSFNEGANIDMSCEYLRVYSPSAEVRGHGAGQEVLQLDKETVNIMAIESVGNYAVRLVFSDGHETGLYTWSYLLELAEKKQSNWQDYLTRLEQAGHQRNV